MPVIDTHAHIYSPDEKRYPPIEKPLRPPGGKASVEDLKKECEANGVTHACAIQTSTFYRFDNRYTCDASAANKEWIAGVCTLDPDNPESPALLRQFAGKFNIKGMRSIPARDGRLDHPGVRALWRTATDLGLVINVLINRDKEDQCAKLLKDFAALRVVLDHCLNIKAGPDEEAILAAVLRLSVHRNLHAKLTFIPTGSATGFPCSDMHASCLKIIDVYGADRCIWGSDFPNALWTPRVSFAEHIRIFREVLPLKESARARVLGETAHRLWFR